jgi:hypothetical protein
VWQSSLVKGGHDAATDDDWSSLLWRAQSSGYWQTDTGKVVVTRALVRDPVHSVWTPRLPVNSRKLMMQERSRRTIGFSGGPSVPPLFGFFFYWMQKQND